MEHFLTLSTANGDQAIMPVNKVPVMSPQTQSQVFESYDPEETRSVAIEALTALATEQPGLDHPREEGR